MTSPMPTLPEFGLDEENRELQGLVFTTISAGQRAKVHPEGGEATANESVGMIVISQECESWPDSPGKSSLLISSK